jgi:UDP:flavonoid glycosyltransferase YjiC (YdhE family)
MKVLVVSIPASGHLHPLLPLTGALLAQGDEVVIASGSDMGDTAVRGGARFAPIGKGEMDWFETLRARVRGNPGDGLAPGRINHYFVPRLFADIGAADMVDDLLALGRELRPDVVLFETYAFAAPLVADLLGVPAVHHLISPMLQHDIMELANDAVSPLWRSFGRDAPGYAGIYRGLTIEVAPPSLEALEVPGGERLALRPAPLPAQPPAPSRPPLVYVTLGTFFAGNVALFRTLLQGLDGVPVDVLVTVGADNDPAALGPVPATTRVERFVPQAEVLPRCSAVVHHGGSGTMFGSLAHGLPQVVVPQGADNFLNGDLLARAGVARILLPDEVTPERVGDAVRAVLDDDRLRRAARSVAAEIAAMPGPAEVAQTLRARVTGTTA